MYKIDKLLILLFWFCVHVTVQANWWYLGTLSLKSNQNGGRLKRAQSCENLYFLTSHQRELCKKSHDVELIGEGAALGIEECQVQFKAWRWNCSTFNTTNVFGRLLDINGREKAFVHSIMSSGVMHIITRACASGEMMHCGCNEDIRYKDTKGKFEWGGCSHDTRYSDGFTAQFVDNQKDNSVIDMMNKWNNKAGRQVIKKSLRLVCKCHGISGSCSLKICWKMLTDFHVIGKKLQQRYNGASQVKLNKKGKRLKPVDDKLKKPKKADLVYLDKSPDYCEPDAKSGSLGTHGRRCNMTSLAMDGCQLMCCGRGYYTVEEEVIEEDCHFEYCCRVVCVPRPIKVEFHYCN